MSWNRSRWVIAVAAVLACTASPIAGAGATPTPGDSWHGHQPGHREPLRVATYNASLNRTAEGQLVDDLSTPDNAQAQTIAEVLQRVRPDIVLLNEFDYDAQHRAVDLFRANYLKVGQYDADPIDYPYAYTAPSNTGIPSGLDLDNNGLVGGANDAFGFGEFPGQYGMVVLSKYPIRTDDVRTFQNFLWKDMPAAKLPDDPATKAPEDWYSRKELNAVRLSSKSHWDVPIQVGHRVIHVLAAHPTPPTFDGPEDRNGVRNYDEIRFWADYIRPWRSWYVYDDEGHRGGLRPGSRFVILGDQNSDPIDGDSVPGAINQLIDLPWLTDPMATSAGAIEAAHEQGGANESHQSPSKYDTADFDDTEPGNLRADYVLPSLGLRVRDAGVFWPARSNPLWRLTGEYPFPSSDHRLVWVDLHG